MTNEAIEAATRAIEAVGALPKTRQARIDIEIIHESLEYDPETGSFRWKVRPRSHFSSQRGMSIWNTKYSGKVAGSLDREGYTVIRILERHFYAHRLAWVITHGVEPPVSIDHINGDKSDNRLANLRLATSSENCRNTQTRRDNKSGHKGVSWHNGNKAWVAKIKVHGATFHLGTFEDKQAAIDAYVQGSILHHGEFSPYYPAAIVKGAGHDRD